MSGAHSRALTKRAAMTITVIACSANNRPANANSQAKRAFIVMRGPLREQLDGCARILTERGGVGKGGKGRPAIQLSRCSWKPGRSRNTHRHTIRKAG